MVDRYSKYDINVKKSLQISYFPAGLFILTSQFLIGFVQLLHFSAFNLVGD